MENLQLELDYKGPYALRYHYEGASARRSFWWNHQPTVFDLTQDGDNGPVIVNAYSKGALDPDDIRTAARHMIGADDDLDEFRAAIARDRKLDRLVGALPGLKALRVPDLWTTLLRSLLAQQISVAAARSIREKLSRRYGHVLDISGQEISVVPAPDVIAGLSVPELAAVGLSGRKAEYAIGLAEALLERRIVPEELRRASPDDMIAQLSALRGVGVWTAECVGIFCLGHRDLLPADDLGVQQVIAQIYGLPAIPKAKEVRKRGEKWKGWRSYAAIYFWGARNQSVVPTYSKHTMSATHPPKTKPKPPKNAAKLPPLRTGAKHHTPVAPGRRGR